MHRFSMQKKRLQLDNFFKNSMDFIHGKTLYFFIHLFTEQNPIRDIISTVRAHPL